MSLTVLNVAYPFAPVGRDAVGGAEQVVALLDAALVRAGHRSIVIAPHGSVTQGTLLATESARGPLTDDVRRAAEARCRQAIGRALTHHCPDIVHLHGVDFMAYLPPPGVPVLVTLHLPASFYPNEIFRIERQHTWLHCVSASARRSCPNGARLLPEIENGVPVDALPARCAKHGYAIALGRICPEKGFHLALDAAERADASLFIGGRVFPYAEHERYFQRQILPRLDRRRRFLGPLTFARKRLLLSGARCLLVPSLVPETSSLAAMEAIACGTPVVAFDHGALAEVVEHGKTGLLVTTEQQMADAISAAGDLDPDACRGAARERFSAARTAERYLALYSALSRGAAP